MKILFGEQETQRRIHNLARQVSQDYWGKKPVLVCVLKGAFMFFSDLVKAMSCPVRVEFLNARSYVGVKKEFEPIINIGRIGDLNGKHVLVVEDIVDTGYTLKKICDTLQDQYRLASLRTCVLLDKKEARQTIVRVDYQGFEVPDVFVVGYGLDYEERYRDLPYIAEMSLTGEEE